MLAVASDNLPAKVRGAIAALTRDDLAAGVAIHAAPADAVSLSLLIEHTRFSAQTAVGPGSLPTDVVDVGSVDALRWELDRQLQQVRDELSNRPAP